MGLLDSFCSFVSSAVSVISSALGSAIGSIGDVAAKLLKVAGPWLGAVGQVVSIVATLIGVLKEGDNIEELGAKALDSDKKPEDFDSNAKYIAYLRNEVVMDREKFDRAGDMEKAVRTAVGVSVAAKGVEEKKGFDIPMEAWIAMAKLGFEEKAKEVDTILETFKGDGLKDFADYVDGKLDEDKELQVGDTLVEMYKELDPAARPDDLENKVGNMVTG
jgi:hypothetical protein